MQVFGHKAYVVYKYSFISVHHDWYMDICTSSWDISEAGTEIFGISSRKEIAEIIIKIVASKVVLRNKNKNHSDVPGASLSFFL